MHPWREFAYTWCHTKNVPSCNSGLIDSTHEARFTFFHRDLQFFTSQAFFFSKSINVIETILVVNFEEEKIVTQKNAKKQIQNQHFTNIVPYWLPLKHL